MKQVQRITIANHGVPGELTLIVSSGNPEDDEQNGVEFNIPSDGKDWTITVGDELELSGG